MRCSTSCRSAPNSTASRRRRRGSHERDTIPWDERAQALLDEYVETEPFLVRISAAKRARERVERDARAAGEELVTAALVARSLAALRQGQVA